MLSMLTNLSSKISAVLNPPLKNPIVSPTASTVPISLAKWPSDVTIMGEPLFTRPLTLNDLEALQEAAGLGPSSWWLDAELAQANPLFGNADTLSYEDEISLTALLRAPFEQTGPIRSAARGLLDRLNELERLQTLAIEEGQRRAQGKEKMVRHHSTLQLASDLIDPENTEITNGDGGGGSGDCHNMLHRKDTYAVNKLSSITSSTLRSRKNDQVDILNPRFCMSPERREKNSLEECNLQRTYSKNSLRQLQAEGELKHSLNGGITDLTLSGDSTQLLGRTYDAEELSDVFPSPRASTERLNTTQFPPPPTPSTTLPQGATRHLTFVRQPNQSHALRRDDTIVPRPSNSPMRGARPPAYSVTAVEPQLRDSLPSRLNVPSTANHKLSAPDALGLKTSGSGSNILPNSMSDAMALVAEQEMQLRKSSGRTGGVNVSLTGLLDGSGNGESTNQLNRSFQSEGAGLSHVFEQRNVKDVPPRYDPEGKRAFAGELSRVKSSSQSSLKDMNSLKEIMRAQAESLRASGEQIMQKVNSRGSLNRSSEGSLKASVSLVENGKASPQVPVSAVQSQNEHLNQSIELPIDLRGSGVTYDLKASVNSSIQSDSVAPPKKSTSPVRMRRPSRVSASNVPPPLVLPTDTGDITPETPQTAKTIRPGSYVEQLQSAKHASSAVEAWVTDTVTAMNSETFRDLKDSTETYALPEKSMKHQSKLQSPKELQMSSPRLRKAPLSSSPRGENLEDVMLASQSTTTAKTPSSSTGRPSVVVRRGIAPIAIGGGGRGGRGISALRPPTTLRSRLPIATSTTVTKATLNRGAQGQASQLRPPSRVLRNPSGRGGGSVPTSTSRNPTPPKH